MQEEKKNKKMSENVLTSKSCATWIRKKNQKIAIGKNEEFSMKI